MTYYIKGGSRYNAANPKVWVGLFLGGFPDADYLLTDWVNLDDKGHETAQDPFWMMGGTSGGAKEFELGLWGDFRLKFETTGITYWNGASWEDLLAEGGVSNLSELSDVVITGTPADNEVLAYDNGTSKWINQTPAEAGLATTGDLHAESHSLASHSSEAHSELTDYNAETDVKHITDAQLGALHTIYSLEVHDNTEHDPDYHTESDGTGAVTIHTGITDAGSGIIISDGERTALHPAIGAGDLNHNDLALLNDGDTYEHITQTQKNLLHSIYTLEVHDNTEHNPDYADETRVFEQSSTFPVSPTEGDFHYDEGDDSLYRYNGEAEAWVEVGVGGSVAAEIDNLGNHTATQALAMATFKITGMGDPTNDQDAVTIAYLDDVETPYIASDDLVHSNDNEVNGTNTDYVKLKEIVCYVKVNIRVYWEHYRVSGSDSGKTRVYLNGVGVSSERDADITYTSETHDLMVQPGDLLQVYGYAHQNEPYQARAMYVRNMRIKHVDDFVNNL